MALNTSKCNHLTPLPFKGLNTYFYPAIRSTGRDAKFTVAFFIHFVRLRISQPRLYRSAWNFAWWFGHISDRSSPILGDSPRDGWVIGVNRGHMVGSYFSINCVLMNLIAGVHQGATSHSMQTDWLVDKYSCIVHMWRWTFCFCYTVALSKFDSFKVCCCSLIIYISVDNIIILLSSVMKYLLDWCVLLFILKYTWNFMAGLCLSTSG